MLDTATADTTNTDGLRLNNIAKFGVDAITNGVDSTKATSLLSPTTSDVSFQLIQQIAWCGGWQNSCALAVGLVSRRGECGISIGSCNCIRTHSTGPNRFNHFFASLLLPMAVAQSGHRMFGRFALGWAGIGLGLDVMLFVLSVSWTGDPYVHQQCNPWSKGCSTPLGGETSIRFDPASNGFRRTYVAGAWVVLIGVLAMLEETRTRRGCGIHGRRSTLPWSGYSMRPMPGFRSLWQPLWLRWWVSPSPPLTY